MEIREQSLELPIRLSLLLSQEHSPQVARWLQEGHSQPNMARLFSSGWENKSTTNFVEWQTNTGTIAISTTTVRSGVASLRCNPTASTGFVQHQFRGSSSLRVFLRVYIYIATSVSTDGTTIASFYNGTVAPNLRLNINRTVTLGYFDGSVQQTIGSASPAIPLNTWTLLELSYDDSDANNTEVGMLNGVQFATGNGPDSGGTSNIVSIGVIDTTTADCFFDDFGVNDTSGSFQTSFLGAGAIIHLNPDSAGDANGYLVTNGGTAGAANNFTRVNETPPDDATTYNASVLLSAEDLMNCSASGIGASDTVNVVSVGVRAADLVAADATTAFKIEIEKTASGTKTQSVAQTPNSTTWKTNGGATPAVYLINAYQDPDGAAWTQTTLDSMQIGYIVTAAGVRTAAITKIWALVDTTPFVAPATNLGVTALMMGI